MDLARGEVGEVGEASIDTFIARRDTQRRKDEGERPVRATGRGREGRGSSSPVPPKPSEARGEEAS